MSRKGQCLDNAPMESFFVSQISLKKALVHRTTFSLRHQAKAEIFGYIEVFYNRQRRHSAIDYKMPCQAYEANGCRTGLIKLSGNRDELGRSNLCAWTGRSYVGSWCG